MKKIICLVMILTMTLPGFAISGAPAAPVTNAALEIYNPAETTIPDSINPDPLQYYQGNDMALSGASSVLHSLDPLTNWHWRNPLPQGNSFSGVAYGNGIFVAVGQKGTILTSPDGANWNIQKSGTTTSFAGIIYSNGTFTVLGYGGMVLTSTDGKNWTNRSIDKGTSDSEYYRGIAYGNGTFVVVGEQYTYTKNSLIKTSTDGVNWTSRNANTPSSLKKVTYNNGAFLVFGSINQSGTGRDGLIMTSIDGIDWTDCTSGNTNNLMGVTYGNGTYIAAGDAGTVLASQNGSGWVKRTSGTEGIFTDIIFGNGTFVAVGRDGLILTSADSITWTNRMSGTTGVLKAVAYGNGTFVAVGVDGIILSSTNGIIWTNRAPRITAEHLLGVTYGSNSFVAVGNRGTILTSADGVYWNSQKSDTRNYLKGATYSGSIFAAVGAKTIQISRDGKNWEGQSVVPILNSVAYGGGNLVAVGEGGAILTSSDSGNWISRTSGTESELMSITYGSGTFVAAGNNGTILTSPNGRIWTKRTVKTTEVIFAIAYGGGTFVALDNWGTILTSADGQQWNERSNEDLCACKGLTYDNGTFVGITIDGIVTSHDGASWTIRPALDVYPHSIAYGKDTIVVVGSNGIIIQSDPQPPAAPTEVAAVAKSTTTITVSWKDNAANETGFRIFRKKADENYQLIDTVGTKSNGFIDKGLTPGTNYTYKVQAYNNNGVSDSNEVSVRTGMEIPDTLKVIDPKPISAPQAPSELKAKLKSPTTVELTWKDNSSNESCFRLFRKEGNGDYVSLGRLDKNVTTYTDSGLKNNVTYTYKVRAENHSEMSSSNEVSIKTLEKTRN